MRAEKMSSEELSSWRSARMEGFDGSPASSRALGERLARASALGDAAQVDRLLAQGASAEFVGSLGMAAFSAAMEGGHLGVGLTLLAAAGWGRTQGCSKPGDAADASEPWQSKDAEDPAPLDIVDARGFSILSSFAQGPSWEMLGAARRLVDPAMSDAALLGLAMKEGNFPLMLDASKAGSHPGKREWDRPWKAFAADHLCRWRGQDPTGWGHLAAGRAALFEWLAEPLNMAEASSEAVEAFFQVALYRADAGLMAALLDAGIKPSADWSLGMLQDDHGRPRMGKFSMLWAAARLPDAEMLGLLAQCQAIVDAARSFKEAPESMAQLGIQRLMALADLGVPLDGVDEDGDGLAHAWAWMDHCPRAGWPTLMKKFPEVFNHRNDAGITGAQQMADKLRGKERLKFEGLLARAESREIGSGVKAPKRGMARSASRL